MDKEKYINHIQDEEIKKTIKYFTDSLFVVSEKGFNYATDFFNPKEIEYAVDILNTFPNIDYKIEGGFKNAERSIIVIGKYVNEYIASDYLKLYKIENYGEDITHRDILGAVLNLGIDRKKIGDIGIYENYAIISVKDTVAKFIDLNLNKIKNYNIFINEIDNFIDENLIIPKEKTEEFFGTVSSLRLDSIVSEIINISRSSASDLINRGYVKLNFEQIFKISEEVEENSLISIRGYGRFILSELKGKSKKGRQKIMYEKIL